MKYFSWIALSAGILAANGAAAQSSSNGFYINGYAELSYIDGDIDGLMLARTQLDFGIEPNAAISGLPIGFSLGIDAFSTDTGNGEVAFYPALTFGIGANSLVSVGIPRTVVDSGYIPNTNFAHNSITDLEFSTLTGAFLAYSNLVDDIDVYGIRYDGTFGNTKVGASYHRVNSDADVYSLAFSHAFATGGSFPSVMVFGGIEHLNLSSGDLTNYRLGAEGGNDTLNVGLILSDTATFGDAKSAELYASYNITDSWTASATVLHFKIGGTATLYGIGVEYSFLNNGYVDASVVSGSGFSTNYEVSVGWKF